jgi:Family of unknown function (DUF6130)
MRRSLAALSAVLVLAAAGLAGCSKAKPAAPAAAPTSVTLGERPSSPAKLVILSPRNGQTVPAGTLRLELELDKAKIVNVTSTRVRPDQGHVHVLVDGQLVAMNYSLDGPLPALAKGQHVIRVEFVGADHLPFDPRVSTQTAFLVK